jgi:hypothetical protein
MKKRAFAVIGIFVSLSLPGLGQETPKNYSVTSAATMDMGKFTIHPPTGNGWRLAGFDPAKHPDAKTGFHNPSLKAWATVEDKELKPPADDVNQRLLAMKEEIDAMLLSREKVVLFEGKLETHSGAECLHLRTIRPATAELLSDPQFGASASANFATHSLICIYGEKHDRVTTLNYLYPTQGKDDAQSQHVRDFFASVKFKDAPAK